MIKTWTFLVVAVLLLSACGTKATPTPTAEPVQPEPTATTLPTAAPTATTPPTAEPTTPPTSAPTATAPPTAEPTAAAVAVPEEHPGLPLLTDRGELFAASGVCAICHTNMTDASGADVSIDAFWRSTMMANSSRDPYWQASFKSEVLKSPDYQEVIEDKCTTCHTPMARFTAFAGGGKGRAFKDGFFDPAHQLHPLALDGVSCTLCHQIQETNFGQPESYSGGFVIDTELPTGERLSFGPYPVDEAQALIMQGASGFIPVQSPHVHQSELCATCHTLYTPYLDAAGQIAGEFPEQTPYLEWLHSEYRQTQACQGCHMPQADGGVVISLTGGDPRSPFRQHFFVGGNFYVLELLQKFGGELATTASSEHFGATLERLIDQLQNRTATVTLEEVRLADARLVADVVVESQVGHKFPTAYPSRRAWLHFTVHDASGQLVFESGAFNPDGSIVHNDNDDDPARYEPHYLAIEGPDQVQIYEAIMGDSEGEVTTTLLRGAGYLKDNRLLPAGFESDDEDIAVHGSATEDPDFVGGGDGVQYDVPLSQGAASQSDAQGPFTVTVELLYQSISYRWADNLRQYEAPEIARFVGYQQAVPNLPVVVASATAEVGD